MTGRPRTGIESQKKTNYSSFPRVSAGFAVIHSLSFIFAAAATAVGGLVQRSLGQRTATGVVAAILFGLSILLLAVMIRFKKVEIIPKSKTGEMQRWNKERRDSVDRRASLIAESKTGGRKDLYSIPEEDIGWRPLILGNPTSTHRRVNVLELGSLTRWTEIRKRNRLINDGMHAHLNRRALEYAREEIEKRGSEFMDDIHHSGERLGPLAHKDSRRSLRSMAGSNRHLGTSGIELQVLDPQNPSEGENAHQHTPSPGKLPPEHESVRNTDSSDIEPDTTVFGRDPEVRSGQSRTRSADLGFENVGLEDGTAVPRLKSQNKQD